ncbi:MAG: site-2 protease family protein [Aureliella sp.]
MHIGTVRGIKLQIHWTFWILMAVYLLPVLASQGFDAAVAAAAFIGGVFACVVAHEFGHAAAAGYYGIKTADITLLPIGGVARLTRLPDKPMQELVVALAGPAVNVVIAFGLWGLYAAGLIIGSRAPSLGMEMDLVAQLIAANIFLCLFNLLPAFPMDGGRVLRGLLAMRMPHLRATQIAARVGRWMALLFLILSFRYGFSLLLIAGFIFFAGTAELLQAKFRAAAQGQGQSPFGPGTFDPNASAGSPWFTKAWPEQGSFHPGEPGAQGPHSSGSPSEDVIDAVDVRRVD